MNAVIQEQYTPRRGSDQTERRRLAARVEALETKWGGLNTRLGAGPDNVVSRSLLRVEKDLGDAREALRLFDLLVQQREAAEDSPEASTAEREFFKHTKLTEAQAVAFAGTLRKEFELAQAYTESVGNRDAARFPHPHIVKNVVGKRVARLLRDAGLPPMSETLPFPHGTVPLDQTWKRDDR